MDTFDNIFIKQLEDLYGTDNTIIGYQKKRYNKLVLDFQAQFHKSEVRLISTPGRTELSGNHTDHNNGIVLAASINLDSIAACSKTSNSIISILSEGYDEIISISLNQLDPLKEEEGSTASLVRGIASRFIQLGYKIGGFDAAITSDVLQGSGLSSSASIEVLIGTIFNALYNEGNIDPKTIAQVGQYAENEYFGKPCGLMDQMACAIGGIVKIDFADHPNPQFDKIDISFEDFGYKLFVVNCGEGHDNLTNEYASIPTEMKLVAKEFNNNFLRDIDSKEFHDRIAKLRKFHGDRAVLRSLHFFHENERVEKQFQALKNKEIDNFLELVNESGNSSFKYLQNIFPTINPHKQPLSLALAITEEFIKKVGSGACRVHGGGFAGTILVFLTNESIDDFKNVIEPIFGSGSIKTISIRKIGTYIFR